MNSKNLVSLILLISGFINPVLADETSLIIENAWIAEAPPVSKVMVAYMTVKNTGPKAIEIIRAESDLYSSIEFHETIHEDGMARMIRHDSLIISANNRLELKRGGPHLMLFNPTKRLNAGDTVNIKFTTKNNITKTVAVAVKKAQF
jgi:copper(I)-binding protein